MTTASEIITDALFNINVLAMGAALPAPNAAYCLRNLNDLVDSLSTDKDFIYTTTENITAWTPGQYQYSVGNPVGGTFSGTLVLNSPIVSGVTIPASLIVGGTVTDTQAALPAGTTVLSIGTNIVTLSANALQTVAAPELFTYTTPGNLTFARPLRFNSGYTRITSGISGLDYWIDCISMERYNEVGFKGNPGPWPTVMAYQPTYPLGTLWVYPTPSQAGEVHLFTDLILSEFSTVTTNYNLPQGYTRALKKLLAIELAPSFGKQITAGLQRQAAEARGFLKALNASPVVTLHYDSDIVRAQQHDASWIINGGFT